MTVDTCVGYRCLHAKPSCTQSGSRSFLTRVCAWFPKIASVNKVSISMHSQYASSYTQWCATSNEKIPKIIITLHGVLYLETR